MSKPKIEKNVSGPGGNGSVKQHRQAARVAVSTTSRVVSVAPHERRIIIGPNGRTLHKLLKKHSVRMSLSRGGQVTVLGQEQRVAHAVSHISRLLGYAAPSTSEPMVAVHNVFLKGHAIRSQRVQPHTDSPSPEDSCVPPLKERWARQEVLRALGRRLGAAIRGILDFMTSLPYP